VVRGQMWCLRVLHLDSQAAGILTKADAMEDLSTFVYLGLFQIYPTKISLNPDALLHVFKSCFGGTNSNVFSKFLLSHPLTF